MPSFKQRLWMRQSGLGELSSKLTALEECLNKTESASPAITTPPTTPSWSQSHRWRYVLPWLAFAVLVLLLIVGLVVVVDILTRPSPPVAMQLPTTGYFTAIALAVLLFVVARNRSRRDDDIRIKPSTSSLATNAVTGTDKGKSRDWFAMSTTAVGLIIALFSLASPYILRFYFANDFASSSTPHVELVLEAPHETSQPQIIVQNGGQFYDPKIEIGPFDVDCFRLVPDQSTSAAANDLCQQATLQKLHKQTCQAATLLQQHGVTEVILIGSHDSKRYASNSVSKNIQLASDRASQVANLLAKPSLNQHCAHRLTPIAARVILSARPKSIAGQDIVDRGVMVIGIFPTQQRSISPELGSEARRET
ncbi:hypothetical protein K0504_02290 [Neiella marina]|uniref:OmpA-like domain-containing protein n=1 Tax=Neiella holothuriorum TaxID=2870530 RepID=A0ABS7EDG3_9GAMM|nr:hypothetical protein [Neiella holothuriorum]MBW8189851.1 hypothetical protein [Neiella holothuriorum]